MNTTNQIEVNISNDVKIVKTKLKQKWTKNDIIIALLYSKFGFRKLGIKDDDGDVELECFVNEYIGSNSASLKMEAMNINYILGLKNGELKIDGLAHYSKIQESVVYEYDSYNESELADIVNNILDNITEEERQLNLENSSIRTEIANKKLEAKLKARNEKKVENKRNADVLKKIGTRYCISAIVDGLSKYYISGDEIEHCTYGKGLIKEVDGKKMSIDFGENGLKLLFFNEDYFKL